MAPFERFRNLTIASVLTHRATRTPGAPFLLADDSALTCAEVEDQAEALAASLAHRGVEAGERIATVLPSWPEFAVTVFAAAKLGAVVVPLDPRLPRIELRYMLRHSGAACAVTAEDAFGTDYLQLFEDLLEELPELGYVVTVGEEDLWYDDQIFQWEDLLSAGAGRDFAAAPADPDDTFAIVYTAGTTGKPKGVALTHRNLLHAAAATAGAIGLGPGDIVVGVRALFQVFGLGPGLLGTLLGGAGLVLADGADAAETLDLAVRHRATVHYGIPSMFARELREIERRGRRPASIRACLVSGAPMRDELARRIEASFGAPVVAAYSLTEAASTLAVARLDDPPDKRIFTLGRPIADTSVRVTEPDGADLPPESVGEIRVRGPGVMRGYHRQPGATSAATDARGYLRTGDLGMLDEEGYLHLLGRREEAIMRDGFNIYPREIEDRLVAHPALERAAAVGVPDETLGEAVCACVVRVEGGVVSVQEVREWCSVTLAEYKVPDLVTFMEDLPLTRTGKVWRTELARRLSAEPQGRVEG